MRTAELDSVTLATAADAGAFTIPADDLGAETGAEPIDTTEANARGLDVDVVDGYNITVVSKRPGDFTAVDDWQATSTLLNITFNYTDGTSAKFHRVGFTATEEIGAQLGTRDGLRLTGTNYGLVTGDVVTPTPALPT